MALTRIKDGNNSGVYLSYRTDLDTANLPTAPQNAPTNPKAGEVIIETLSNDYTTDIRAVIRWTYNGSDWEQVGSIEWNTITLIEDIPGYLDNDNPPSVPVNNNLLRTVQFVPGDTLFEAYENGYVTWLFDGTDWVFRYLRVNTNISVYHQTSFNAASVPSVPVSTPNHEALDDIIIEKYDTAAGTERVTITWRYDGSAWVMLGHPQYQTRHFHDAINATLNTLSLPAAPVNYNSSPSTKYVPGDTLWEEYNNGYVGWTFGTSSWTRNFARAVPSSEHIIYVKDYGAVGDGITDDTAAIQAAINLASPSSIVDFDRGYTYLVTTLTLAASKTYRGASTIKLKNATNNNLIVMNNNCTLDGLTFDGNASNQSTPSYLHGTVLANNKSGIYIKDCAFNNAYGSPIYIRDCPKVKILDNVINGAVRPAIFLSGNCGKYVIAGNTLNTLLEDGIKVSATWQEDIRTANTLGSITSSTSFSGTLAPYIPVVSGLNAVSIIVQVASVTVETFRDNDGDGILTGSAGGTGTINYTTGAVTLTLTSPLTATIKGSWIMANAKDCSGGHISNNILDYSASNLTVAYVDTSVLGIEVWTSNPAVDLQTVKHTMITNNRVIGPSSFTLSGDFFAISAHGIDKGIVTGNSIYNGKIDYGIETVLSKNILVADNQIRDYLIAGITIPAGEKRTEFVLVNGNEIGPAGGRAAYGIFVPANATEAEIFGINIFNNVFYDAGFGGVYFKNSFSNSNGSGRGSKVSNNSFVHDAYIEYEADLTTVSSPIYDIVFEKTTQIEVTNNKSFSRFGGLSSNPRVFLRLIGVTDSFVNDNIVDGMIASTNTVPTRPAIWVLDVSPNTGAGSIIFKNNVFVNWQRGIFIENSGGNQATGNPCRLVNNIYINNSATNTIRTTDIVQEYKDTGLNFYINGAYRGFTYGTGSPESVVTGNVGDIFIRTDGSTGTTLYVKESGTGNTGWVGHGSGGGGGTDTKTTIYHASTFNTSSIPSSPVSPPGSPTTNDIHIEMFDNTNGDSRVLMFWKYNGSTWVSASDTEYNIRSFSVSVGSNLNPSSLPTTPNTPGAATDYIPGDVLHEEYNNGYMRWTYTTGGWVVSLGRVYTTNNLVSLGSVSSFNMNSVPTTPSSPPSSPKANDVYIETYNNTNMNQKVIIRWTYNGSSWVMNGTPEYNLKRYFATVASNLTAGSLPSTPATPGSSTGYVTGDTLLETYNNGQLEWTYATSSWTLSASRVHTNNTYVVKSAVNWDETGSAPTTPNSPPSSPLVNDILIQSYDNTTRNNAVTRYWSYNGSSWVALTNGIHRFNMVFTNAPAVALTYGVAPTASLAATTTSYVNGDILWEKYTNGYGLYKFNNGTWTLQVSGLEVGRIQDSADFQATLGPGVDGYYLIYDHDILKFTLSAT